MGILVTSVNVGQRGVLETRGDLSWKRICILMVLMIILLTEKTDAVSDFGHNSLTIQSNEDFFRSTPTTGATRPRKVRYTVRLHLPGIKMNRQLSDRNSSQYTTLSRSLSKDLQRLFADTVGKQRISNMRFTEFEEQHREHESLNEAGSAQDGLHLFTSPTSPKSLLTSPSSKPRRPVPRKRAKQRANRAFRRSRPTVAAVTSSRRRARRPQKQTVTTAKLFDENFTTATTTVPATTMAVTSLPTARTTTTTTTAQRPSTTASEQVFDVARITGMFKECFTRASNGDYTILLEKYLDAYTELMSIFKLFGPVFSFAGDDIKDKLTKLRDLRKRDMELSQNNYTTFQSMFEYEHSLPGSPADQEGVSTNKWIHRALRFISELIKASLTDTSEKSLGDHAYKLYTDILAPYHAWYVRTVAYLALLSFPTRSHLIELMGLTESDQDLQKLADLSSAIEAVYQDVENLYVKYSV